MVNYLVNSRFHFFANGDEAQRVGVPIDIPVRYTIKDIVNGKDKILERAIGFANSAK